MKFIVTSELGRLSRWLRILGYDTVYFQDSNAASLLIQALRDERIIITRNVRLFHKLRLAKAVQIKHNDVKEQLSQVLKDLKLTPDSIKMFSRCTICNEELISVEKERLMNKIPEYVFNTQEAFLVCSNCHRIYWKGTHWGNVSEFLGEL